jgi:hypothetical protein
MWQVSYSSRNGKYHSAKIQYSSYSECFDHIKTFVSEFLGMDLRSMGAQNKGTHYEVTVLADAEYLFKIEQV